MGMGMEVGGRRGVGVEGGGPEGQCLGVVWSSPLRLNKCTSQLLKAFPTPLPLALPKSHNQDISYKRNSTGMEILFVLSPDFTFYEL